MWIWVEFVGRVLISCGLFVGIVGFFWYLTWLWILRHIKFFREILNVPPTPTITTKVAPRPLLLLPPPRPLLLPPPLLPPRPPSPVKSQNTHPPLELPPPVIPLSTATPNRNKPQTRRRVLSVLTRPDVSNPCGTPELIGNWF